MPNSLRQGCLKRGLDALLSILLSIARRFVEQSKAATTYQRDYSFLVRSTEKQNSKALPITVGEQSEDCALNGDDKPMEQELEVINIIDQSSDGRYRKLIKPEMVVIHRIGPKLHCGVNNCAYCDSADAKTNSEHSFGLHVNKWFQYHPKIGLTGGNNPYHFVVGHGKTFQCLPLRECGVHARRWNIKSLAIAVQGNFEHEHPSTYQKYAVDLLSAALCRFQGKVDVWGHTELSEGSKDRLKRCPGTYMYMHNRRENIKRIYAELASRELSEILSELNITIE